MYDRNYQWATDRLDTSVPGSVDLIAIPAGYRLLLHEVSLSYPSGSAGYVDVNVSSYDPTFTYPATVLLMCGVNVSQNYRATPDVITPKTTWDQKLLLEYSGSGTTPRLAYFVSWKWA